MAPTVNELTSPTFFAPLPFQGAMPQAAGATSARNDHGNSSAHGVKRDASQMMTSEERSERVRKIVSLVKVLLTGTFACPTSRDAAASEERHPPHRVQAGQARPRGRKKPARPCPLFSSVLSLSNFGFNLKPVQTN